MLTDPTGMFDCGGLDQFACDFLGLLDYLGYGVMTMPDYLLTGGGSPTASGLKNKIKQAGQGLVCAAAAPLIASSIANSITNGGTATSSFGGTGGFTYGDMLQGRDWNWALSLDGDSWGNISFTSTTGNQSGPWVLGAGWLVGLPSGTSQGTVGDLNGPGTSVWAGYGPASLSVSQPTGSGFAASYGRGGGVQYGAYNHTNTTSLGKTNCTGPAISGVLAAGNWLFDNI